MANIENAKDTLHLGEDDLALQRAAYSTESGLLNYYEITVQKHCTSS